MGSGRPVTDRNRKGCIPVAQKRLAARFESPIVVHVLGRDKGRSLSCPREASSQWLGIRIPKRYRDTRHVVVFLLKVHPESSDSGVVGRHCPASRRAKRRRLLAPSNASLPAHRPRWCFCGLCPLCMNRPRSPRGRFAFWGRPRAVQRRPARPPMACGRAGGPHCIHVLRPGQPH